MIKMSEEQEHVDERITFLFSLGLTAAERALCLAGEPIHIRMPHLRRQLARNTHHSFIAFLNAA